MRILLNVNTYSGEWQKTFTFEQNQCSRTARITVPTVTQKSALGTALSYMRDYWSMLTRYTERGDLPIDNNPCENAIRPFVIAAKPGCLVTRLPTPTPARLFTRCCRRPRPMDRSPTPGCVASCVTCPQPGRWKKWKPCCRGICMHWI